MPTFKQLWNAVVNHQSIDPATDRIVDALGDFPINMAVLAIGTIGMLALFSFDDWRKQFRRRRPQTWAEALQEQEASYYRKK